MNEDASLSAPEQAPEQRGIRVAMPSAPPVMTYSLIGVTVAVYLLQIGSVALFGYAVGILDWLELYGARINEFIRAGQVWRLITPVFLHGSPMHILFNMYALYSIGTFLEKQYGRTKFIALYFIANFAGYVFSFLFTGDDGFSVGASTAIFGLIAAEFILFYQNRDLFGDSAKRAMGNAVFFIVLNLFISLTPGIDLWGHVGGLLGGAIFAWFGGPRWRVAATESGYMLKDQREFRETLTGASAAILIFAALAVWGILR